MSVDPTWVRPEPGWVCPECGFDFDACDPAEASALMREFASRYRIPLERGLPGEDLPALLRTRPPAGGWSALEYACHARDVFALYDTRITATLKQDRPSFPKMNRDQLAEADDYNGQDPTVVADQLAKNTQALAVELEGVPPESWERVGVRDDLEMSVDWMTRNAVHEGRHHLLDVGRMLRAARRGGSA